MHDKGVLLHAHGRQPIDYISQAIFCASHIKKFLQLPVALVTSEKSCRLPGLDDHVQRALGSSFSKRW